MGFNFPNAPTPGQVYVAPGGPQYVFSEGVCKVAQSLQTLATARMPNKIVNPSMRISQETGYDVVVSANGAYFADQWNTGFTTSGAPAFMCRLADPTPYPAYLRLNSGGIVDASIATADYVALSQKMMIADMDPLCWGLGANARPAVLRFSARSFNMGQPPLTITASLRNWAGTRSFTKNVVLPTTWTDFVIPIPPCSDGAWNGAGNAGWGFLGFCGMCGATYGNGIDNGAWNNSNSLGAPGISNMMAVVQQGFDLTNVGFYVDPDNTKLAPPYEDNLNADDYRACQRFYIRAAATAAGAYRWCGAAGGGFLDAGYISFPAQMRTSPTYSFETAPTYVNSSNLSQSTADALGCTLRCTATAIGIYRATGALMNFDARL